jgi:hypothetical protein
MMSTPGGGAAYAGFGLVTPSTNLNFAEFLNMTPSPAQVTGSWNRTPIAGVPPRTPAAVREARRRLNFENLHGPNGENPHISKVEGLGMELGGELVS